MMRGPRPGFGMGPAPWMQGRQPLGPRPAISPERRAEIAKRVEQARSHADAAKKKAMAAHEHAKAELLKKKEAAKAAEKKGDVKKADQKKHDVKKDDAKKADDKKPVEKKGEDKA